MQRKKARGVGRTSLSATKCDGNVTSTHCCAKQRKLYKGKGKKFSKEKEFYVVEGKNGSVFNFKE